MCTHSYVPLSFSTPSLSLSLSFVFFLVLCAQSIFGKTQHIFRYGEDETCKELVGDCVKECDLLEKGLKKVAIDKVHTHTHTHIHFHTNTTTCRPS
jgi:hypothetical protein